MQNRLWLHQQRTLDEIRRAREDGHKRILVTAPTGSGKTRIMEELLEHEQSAVLYTDRRMLFEQLADRLGEAGYDFGLRASGYEFIPHFDIQLAMVQTEVNRVLNYQQRQHHQCDTVILDEAHRMKADQMQAMLDLHKQDGATVIGFTATPIECGGIYDKLIVAASNSECRECGAHVRADTYAPSEIDMSGVGRQATGEFEIGEMATRFKRPVVFGNVFDHWQRLNPDGKPTILFGPDVAGSHWFCEQFEAQGIPAAHIDAKRIVMGGEEYEATAEARHQLVDRLKRGEIQVLCNRFVLREGIDIPELYCAIFACAIGTLTGYLQAGGRVLRNHPSLDHVIVIDHGGNWHRHGSLNADRTWSLENTEDTIRKEREQNLREDKEPEPIVCPECGKCRASGNYCPDCGHVSTKKSRVVIQKDGSLKEVSGDIYKPRRESNLPKEAEDWKSCLFRCANAKRPMSFNQARGLFAKEHGGRWPSKDWPLVPHSDVEGMRKVTRAALSEFGNRDSGGDTLWGG